jgi:chlorophyll/bacteriochlorophyll a synthase
MKQFKKTKYMYRTSTSVSTPKSEVERPPLLRRSLGLMKPITWFGPMWAFLCGAVASGATSWSLPDVGRILLGVVLAGPILCGFSQVINDYFDREVDAINEPQRLIPSGFVSDQQVIIMVTVLMALGLSIAFYMGSGVALFVAVGLVFAFAYSAPPLRAKRNGWVGNTMVAVSYEGLAWMAGHLAFAPLTIPSILVAALYSFGSHGIMSINDYKSIAGDRLSGIRTIPVLLGPKRAAWSIILTMDLAQIGVIAAMIYWGMWVAALVLGVILVVQLPLQRSFLEKPAERHLKFSAVGVSFFVWGMMVAAVAVRSL